MYTLQVSNREVLKVISKALELYARCGCEQWEHIKWEFEKLPLDETKVSGNHLSIRADKVPNKSKIAYDVLTIVNHRLASENPGVAASNNVWLNQSEKVGSEPMCSIEGLNLNPVGPQIDFCFGGHVMGAKISTAIDGSGNKVDVSKMKPDVLAEKLNEGKLFISLGDYLYDNNKDTEIEITDFTPYDQFSGGRED